MDNWLSWIRAATAALGTAATYLMGGWDAVLMALVVLVCLDYATGLMAAWVQRGLDSRVGVQGIAKKIGYFILVSLASVIDRSAGLDAPVLRTVAIWFLIANEGLSITENLGTMGVPIPAQLTQHLQRLRQKEDGGDV